MTDSPRTLDDVLDGLRIAMVGTADSSPGTAGGGEWRSRPLALLEQDGSVLRFLVSVQSDWVAALEIAGSPTTATFSDPKKGTHVALQGSARTVDDRAKVAELFNPVTDTFFDGPQDPDVRVLEITVAYGEWWDSPSGGRVGQAVGMLAAKVTGDTGKVGGQGDVEV